MPAAGCNSASVSYYNMQSGTWQSTYTNANHQVQQLSNLIYATGSNINVRTLQTSDAPIVAQINNTLIRVQLHCNIVFESCAVFAFGTVPGNDGNAHATCSF